MDFSKLDRSTAPRGQLKHVQFSILDAETIKSMSVCEKCTDRNGAVIEAGIRDYDPQPKLGGINDPRMGTTRKWETCITCGGDGENCPGHFGHIEFVRPVFHISFLREVMLCMNCVCYSCGMLRLHKDDPELRAAMQARPQNRLQAISTVCSKRKVCNPVLKKKEGKVTKLLSAHDAGCHCNQPAYSMVKKKIHIVAKFSATENDPAREEIFSAEKVYDVLRKIDDDTARILGFSQTFSRPDWMVLRALPVPPLHVRPSVEMDNSESHDDLTHKLQSIIKVNEKLREAKKNNDPDHKIQELDTMMQWEVATLFDNELAGMAQATQKGGRPLKTIRQRIKGKEGRVRGNLMGKRVDFSARSVITPDPNLDLDQVGVPRSVARTLTFPERVTDINISKMHELVRRGAEKYPGANFVRRANGDVINLKQVDDTSVVLLSVGDIVERHIIDDDIVLFNRQPSLHKMSIMGHRVKVLPFSTFRLNLSVTSPYNADFDGDEMNLHVPQTHQARAEVKELMMVHKNIVSPQSNRPVMGIIQDTLLAVSKYTKRDTLLERDMVYNLLLWTTSWNGRIPKPAILIPNKDTEDGDDGRRRAPRGIWTGKQLFSMLLPDNLNLRKKSKTHGDGQVEIIDPRDTAVLIENGQLLRGIIDKNSVGKNAGGIIHLIMNDSSPKRAREFVGSIQKQINYWLLHNGFTVGVSDTIADKSTLQKIGDTIEDATKKMQALILKLQEGKLKPEPGMSLMATFESDAQTILDDARNRAGKESRKSLMESNNLKSMVDAGSKGSFTNIAQICALVGQQAVNGSRIPYGFNKRTLPHFQKDSLEGPARGFVKNSYLIGLTPIEFFFHAMGGREGLIDTAVKTAETGYIQRKLVKSLEDVVVKYDGTVRNSEGMIVQFLYGEDGMDGRWIEGQQIELLDLSRKRLEKRYRYEADPMKIGRNADDTLFLCEEDFDDLKNQSSAASLYGMVTAEFDQIKVDCENLSKIAASRDARDAQTSKYFLPANLDRLIDSAKKQQRKRTHDRITSPATSENDEPLRIAQIINDVKELLKKCVAVSGRDEISVEAQENATRLFKIMVRAKLASKRVLKEYKLSKPVFEELIGEVLSRYNQAMISPNEMIGVVAAQSIGEPTTQMTLNTFHLAGVKQNVTKGVPRLKEIIDVTTNMKTPQSSIYLTKDARVDKAKVRSVEKAITYTTLGDVVTKSEIWYDPDLSLYRVDPANPDSDLACRTVVPGDAVDFGGILESLLDDDPARSAVGPWLLRLELDRVLISRFKGLTQDGDSVTYICDKIKEVLTEHVFIYNVDMNDECPRIWIRLRKDDIDDAMDDIDESGQGSGDHVLSKIEKSLLDDCHLRGIRGITKVYTRKMEDSKRKTWNPENGFSFDKEWTITTDGTNLIEVLSQEYIDHTRTISNDIPEICTVLGIEAARRAICNEIRGVIGASGSYVNYRHLSVLCDIMTCRGYIMPITRHGINRTDAGTLRQASYEETVEIFMRASQQSRKDRLMGPTENVMLGQLCPMGTGDLDCMLDAKMMAEEAPVSNSLNFGDDFEDVGANRVPSTPGAPTPAAVNDDHSLSYRYKITRDSPGMDDMEVSPEISNMDSPWRSPGGAISPGVDLYTSPVSTPESFMSPASGAPSPRYDASAPGLLESPRYSPTSPVMTPIAADDEASSKSMSSPAYSPTSPMFSPAGGDNNTSSPAYSPTSPMFSPTGGDNNTSSPAYSPTSPAYSPADGGMATGSSPRYSPTSPAYSPAGDTTSPRYSPTSPAYSPAGNTTSPRYSPTSPAYSPAGDTTSPRYSPTSPAYSPAGDTTSPRYSPTSPAYSPAGDTTSPRYSPTSPAYSPAGDTTSPRYSPTSPAYSPAGDTTSPRYSPTSPAYSPTSPAYSPAGP